MRITRWAPAAAMLLLGAALVADRWSDGEATAAVALGGGALVVALLLVLLLGRTGRHVPWAQAKSRVTDGHAVVFWKPGCWYCERLLLTTGSDPSITWVNVYVDREANDEVRRLNGGDELTPTAVVGEQVLRNPSRGDLRSALSRP